MITNDFTVSPEKAACRAFNTRVLDESWYLAPRGSLAFDWVELAGKHAPMYDVLAPRLGPGRFIGVDLCQETIADLQASGRQHAVWRHGILHDLLLDEPELFARAGVINFDTTRSWFERDLVEETGPLVRFVLKQMDCSQRRVPHMLLIVNATGKRYRHEDPVGAVLDSARVMLEPLLHLTKAGDVLPEDVYSYPCRGGGGMMHNLRLRLGGWPLKDS